MSRIAALLTVATTLAISVLGCGAQAAGAAEPSTELTSAGREDGHEKSTPVVTSPSAAEGAAFPGEDARTALRAAQGGLRSCSDSAVPQSFDVTLRFEPSGKVSKVDVVPSAGRAASCLRTRLAEVAVTPFKGEPVSLRMPLQL
jgi:hypothetical protein